MTAPVATWLLTGPNRELNGIGQSVLVTLASLFGPAAGHQKRAEPECGGLGEQDLPLLRLILIWANLAGHLSSKMVVWLFAHGVTPLYTPLSGSWLNMAESVQRIPCAKQRRLGGWAAMLADHQIIAA